MRRAIARGDALQAVDMVNGVLAFIYAEVGKHLATLDLHQMRQQPIYAFFEEDSTMWPAVASWTIYKRPTTRKTFTKLGSA